MKATINPISLSKELKKMSSIVKKNHIIPITSAVLFSFSKDKLTVSGTDLETTYVISLVCSCSDEFSFPIDYFDISEICSNSFIPLTIELKETEILIKSDKSKTRLPRVGNANEFPLLPEDLFKFEKEVEGEFFYHLNYANSCRWNKELNPSLEMAAIIIEKESMDVVGCDGFVMYRKEFIEKSEFVLTVMVPDSFVSLAKWFQSTKLSFGERFIKAEYGNDILISRLSESKYANIKAIIPQTLDYNLTVVKGDLRVALNAISVAAHLTTKQFVIKFDESSIKLISTDTDFDKEAETTIDVDNNVNMTAIMLNSAQLLHLTTLVDTEEMEFAFTEPHKNVYIRPKDDESVLMLLRPLMLVS